MYGINTSRKESYYLFTVSCKYSERRNKINKTTKSRKEECKLIAGNIHNSKRVFRVFSISQPHLLIKCSKCHSIRLIKGFDGHTLVQSFVSFRRKLHKPRLISLVLMSPEDFPYRQTIYKYIKNRININVV